MSPVTLPEVAQSTSDRPRSLLGESSGEPPPLMGLCFVAIAIVSFQAPQMQKGLVRVSSADAGRDEPLDRRRRV